MGAATKTMTRAIVTIKGESPLIFSKRVNWPTARGEKATQQEHDRFREKAHVRDGSVVIPSVMFQRALASTASLLGRKRKGNATYGKAFLTGVICTTDMDLGIGPDDLVPEEILCSSDGKKGGTGGSQVLRVFPSIPTPWSGSTEFLIVNEDITEKEFGIHMEQSGWVNGVGSFRPQNGGMNGRYSVADIVWESGS